MLDRDIHASVEAFADDRDTAPWVQVGLSAPVIADRLAVNASWGAHTGASGETTRSPWRARRR